MEIVVGTASAEQRVAALGKQFASLKGASNTASGAIDDLAQSAGSLGNAVNKSTQNVAKMGQDAKQASQGVDNLAHSTRKLGDNASYTGKLLGGLKGLMAGYFSLAGLTSVLQTADAMQTANTQIKLVTSSTEEYLAVKNRLQAMANMTRQDIEATTGAYVNNARSLSQLGKSQSEIIKFTESVSLAMAVGGKSAQEQASALLQLGQAMQSGVLQGDEFRSIAENAPILLDLVSQSLNKTRGEVKELASQGKISAEVIYAAMAGANEQLQSEFAKMPVTMGQALTVVKNNYKNFVDGFFNQTGGLSEFIAKALMGISKHFDTLAKVGVAGAAVGMVVLASKVTIATTAFSGLATVLRAHPVLAIATAVIGVASAFYGLDDVLGTTGQIFKDFLNLVVEGYQGLGELVSAITMDIKNHFAHSNQANSEGFAVFFDDTANGFAGFLQGIARIVAAATGTLGGFMAWLGNGFWRAMRTVANAFIWAYNTSGDIGDKIINGLIDALNSGIDAINGFILRANNILALTPLNVQFNVVDKINWRSNSHRFSSFDTSGASLSESIGAYTAMAVDIVDAKTGAYFESLGNRTQNASFGKGGGGSGGGGGGTGNKSTDDGIMPLAVNARVLEQAKRYNYSEIESRYGLPAGILAAVSMQESGGNPYARSPVGALGAFQFMPGTAKDYGLKDRTDVGASADAAARYLRDLLKKFGDIDLALAAYNAGQGNVAKYGAKQGKVGAIPPFKETQNYVKQVKRYHKFMDGGRDGKTSISKINDAEYQLEQKQRALAAEYATAEGKMLLAHHNKMAEIAKTFAGDKTQADIWQKKEVERYENEVKAYKQMQQDKLDALAEFKTDEFTLLQRNLQKQVDELVADTSLSDEVRQTMIALATERANHERDLIVLNTNRELLEANRVHMTAIEQIEAEAKLQRDELATELRLSEEVRQARSKAIDIQEQQQLNELVKEQKRLVEDMNDYRLTSVARINRQADRDIEDVQARTDLSAEQKNEQIASINNKRDYDLESERNNIKGQYLGAFGNDISRGLFDLEQQKAERLRILEEAAASEIGIEIDKNAQLLAIERDYHIGVASLQTSQLGVVFDNLANMSKVMVGEQSNTYKRLFAMSKAFTIAEAGLAMYKAISDSWKNGVTTADKIAGAVAASTEMMKIIAAAQQVKMQGFKTGGYTGNVGVNDVAGVVHGKEYVLNAKATKRIGTGTLDKINNGGDIGGVNVIINNYSSEKASVEKQSNGDIMVTIGMMREIARAESQRTLRDERKQGGLLYGA